MNQQEVEQLFLEARLIRLSTGAKRSGRHVLMRRMALEEPQLSTPRFAWFGQSWLRAGGFASVLLLVGTTAWAAETALPGDTLYSWKTGVNEPVRLALLPTTVARAQWSVELFARRLDEAETLASAGALSDETQRLLEEKLNEERERADAYGRSIGGAEENRIETEMQARSEKVTRIEVREYEGRLRIRVREEHEEYESGVEKQREHEVRNKDGWIEETELHDDSRERAADGDDRDDNEQAVTNQQTTVVSPKKSASSASENHSGSKSVESSSVNTRPITESTAEKETSDGKEKEADSNKLISESEARSRALVAVPGTVKESELKDEDLVWEVVIQRSGDGEDVKVRVDAQSGAIKEIED